MRPREGSALPAGKAGLVRATEAIQAADGAGLIPPAEASQPVGQADIGGTAAANGRPVAQGTVFRAREFAELRKTGSIHPESISDDELMHLLRGSQSASEQDCWFDEFHRRFHRRVHSWCLRLTRNRARASDLTQEVFVKAWRHLDSFRGDSRPSTWLYVITRNHCLSDAQRLASDPLHAGAPLSIRLWDRALPHPDRGIERSQLAREMCELITSTLEPVEAQVFTLHYGYEVPLAAITTRMSLTNPSGAKAYIVNGRRKIRNALERRKSERILAHIDPEKQAFGSRERLDRKIA